MNSGFFLVPARLCICMSLCWTLFFFDFFLVARSILCFPLQVASMEAFWLAGNINCTSLWKCYWKYWNNKIKKNWRRKKTLGKEDTTVCLQLKRDDQSACSLKISEVSTFTLWIKAFAMFYCHWFMFYWREPLFCVAIQIITTRAVNAQGWTWTWLASCFTESFNMTIQKLHSRWLEHGWE